MLERHKTVVAIAAPKWRAPAWIFATVATQLLILSISAKLAGNWGPIPFLLIVGLPVAVWQQLKVAEGIPLLKSLILGGVASVAVLMALGFTLFLLVPPSD